MREIDISSVIELTAKLCMDANYYLNKDIQDAVSACLPKEQSPVGKNVLESMLENAAIAGNERVPICQDTGMAVVFFELGMDVRITGMDTGTPAEGRPSPLEDAINEGVRRGYEEGFLRKSVVRDPVDRRNTGDNTPAVIHYSVVRGNNIKITVAPKGFGSENMSALKMLTPAEGIEGVKKFVVDTVSAAGGNPCPPIIVGVGIGGTMEKCALLSKTALLRPLGSAHSDPFWRGVETELLETINALGIGPAGFGGRTTALGVHIETFATHIAGLPVAVNLGCHVTRHAEGTI
ncbi:MAG: fumarate hydratase [Treponema sp.]|nr:fumarate hydratase [Treponema sp.]